MTQSKEIKWINTTRALCMISVYLLHSEVYYGTAGVSYGYLLTPFYVNAFFFVSGYLFFRKYGFFNGNSWFGRVRLQEGTFRQATDNIFYRIVIPTLLFSTLIYIPKKIFHGEMLSVTRYLHDVFGGVSYWFTSALALAQLILLMLLRWRRTGMLACTAETAVLFIAGAYLHTAYPDPFPWNYQSALTATLLMTFGGLYHRFETQTDSVMRPLTVLAAFVYLIPIILTMDTDSTPTIANTITERFGLVIVLCAIATVVALSHLLPSTKCLTYIGRHSLLFYFFSGVTPALTGSIALRLFPVPPSYGITLLVTVISLAISFLITATINRHFGFLTDLRKLRRRTKDVRDAMPKTRKNADV